MSLDDRGRAAGSFALLALIFGLAMAAVTPPLQVPDEAPHFARAYQLAAGEIVPSTNPSESVNATGGMLPADWPEFQRTFEAINFNPEAKIADSIATYRDVGKRFRADSGPPVFVGFSNTAIHSPLIYFPQALGLLLGGKLSSSILVLLYAGRIFNLLAATLLVALAIWATPVHRWVFVALTLSPMCLFEMSSLSSDAVTIATAFLYIALTFRAAFGPNELVSRRLLIAIVATAAALGLAKQMYYPLVLSFGLVPAARIGGPRRYAATLTAIAGTTLLAVIGWGAVVRRVYTPVREWIDASAQLHGMLADASPFLSAVARTLFDPTSVRVLLHQYVGVLGTLDTPLPEWVVPVHLVGLVIVALVDDGAGRPIPVLRKGVAVAVAAATLLVILVTIYLTWMPVGAPWVQVQGRYFIPLGPLALLPLHGLWRRRTRGRLALPVAVAAYFAILLSGTLVLLVRRYYA